jgi:DNA repair exonuclease SbcCD ATPase subunit
LKEAYTLKECCAMLDVDFKTFQKWLERDGIIPQRSEADQRVRYLRTEQVRMLAARHGRPWPPIVQQPEQITATEAKRLMEQVSLAIRQAQEARGNQAKFEAAVQELQHYQQGLGTIQSDQAALRKQIDGLREEWKHVTSFQSDVAELRGRFHTQWADMETYQKQTDAALEQISTALREGKEATVRQIAAIEKENRAQAERLKEIVAQVEQQADQFGQLIARIDKLAAQLAEIAARAEQAQVTMREQLGQVDHRLQVALTKLRQELSQEFERRAQGIETEQARDLAALSEQVERLNSIATTAEETKIIAAGSQDQATSAAQAVKMLQEQFQAERAARAQLENTVNQLVNAQQQEGQPAPRAHGSTHRRGKRLKPSPADPQS